MSIKKKKDHFDRYRKPTPLYDKSIQQQIQSSCLILIKDIYEKTTANVIPNGERLNALPLRSGTDKDACSCYFYSTLYQRFHPGNSSKN